MGARGFFGREDDGNHLRHRHLVAGRGAHLREDAARRRFEVYRRLVGLDHHQRLALGDALALSLAPLDDLAGILGYAQRR